MNGLLSPARENPIRRLQLALLSIVLLIFIGTAGFMVLGPADPLDALLMTVVTISTVGYQEEVLLDTPATKLFAIALIVAAVLVVAAAVRSVATMVFAEYFWSHVGRQRMQSRIDELAGHVIVCGYGRMGRHVTAELLAEGNAVVIVELDPERVEGIVSEGHPVVDGDASRDETLQRAGVTRARALIAVADTDAMNVLIILSARHLAPSLMIAGRADYPDASSKLERAGANYVLQPHGSGATHLALAVTHPVVEDVLNYLLPRKGDLDLSQLVVSSAGQLKGRSLVELGVELQQVLVLAINRWGELHLPPDPGTVLETGDVLVVAGSQSAVKDLEALA